MRKLFVSFTALVRHLKAGTVRPEDLDSGLFFFGCGHGHVSGLWDLPDELNEILWHYREDENQGEGRRIWRAILDATVKAESEGRIVWNDEITGNWFARLNILLECNGFGQIAIDSVRCDGGYYSYLGVEERVRLAGLDLEVVL